MIKDKTAADRMIEHHVYWAIGAGLIPLPFVDIAFVTAVQLDLVSSLCTLYDVDYSENQGKSWIGALTGASLARYGASFVKAIPIFGTALGTVSMSVLSGSSTYAIGEVFKRHFEQGGSLIDFDPEGFKDFYKEQVERGKQMAKRISQKMSNKGQESEENSNHEKITKQLQRLKDLKNEGLLTDEEYETYKDRLLNKFRDSDDA